MSVSQPPLRVLYNASAVPRRPAGAGVYTVELARALAAREDIDLTVASPWKGMPGDHQLRSPRGPAAVRTAWEFGRLPRLGAHLDSELYHGPHFTVPLGLGIPSVATVHDLTFMRLGRRYSLPHRAYYRMIAESARRATRIIVPSRAVATDMAERLTYPAANIHVVAEAARPSFAPVERSAARKLVAERYGLEQDYFLMVGTLEAGKRMVDAVRAISLLPEGQARKPQLVLAGLGPLRAGLEREARRLKVADRVLFPGYVPTRDLPAMLSGSIALLFLSLWEGFGLPPVEAMACGTPVICTVVPALNDLHQGVAIF
ncbi:MAG: glycosyltransferase family 1 protein, partial [Dehalococcoidia bacterium]